MLKKLAGYFFLSVGSFCFFLTLFHTVVNAQTLDTPDDNAIAKSVSIIPTPTVFVQQSPTAQPFFGQTLPSPTPTDKPTPTPPIKQIQTGGDLESFFTHYSNDYHVDINLLKKIAKCESGFRADAQNGQYQGMFQFAAQTWITNRSRLGLDTNPDLRNNAEEAIRTAAFIIGNGGQNAWAGCL